MSSTEPGTTLPVGAAASSSSSSSSSSSAAPVRSNIPCRSFIHVVVQAAALDEAHHPEVVEGVQREEVPALRFGAGGDVEAGPVARLGIRRQQLVFGFWRARPQTPTPSP